MACMGHHMSDPQLDRIFERRMKHVQWRLDVIEHRHEQRRRARLSKALQGIEADTALAGIRGARGPRRADMDAQAWQKR